MARSVRSAPPVAMSFHRLSPRAARPWIRDREGREIGVEVGQQNVAFTIEAIADLRQPSRPGPGVDRQPRGAKLRLTIASHQAGSRGGSWEDSADTRLEKHLTEVVVELLVTGAANYRDGALAGHE